MKYLALFLLLLIGVTTKAQTDTSKRRYCCLLKGGIGAVTTPPPTNTYRVERTVRFDLTNQYESPQQLPTSPKWNLIGPTFTQAQTAGGYVNATLVDDVGQPIAWSITNLTAFGGTTGSAPTPAVANSGLFGDAIVQYGLVMPSVGDATLRITGLDDTKRYQIHLLANNESWKNASVKIYVGSNQSATVLSNSNFGASTDNEFTAAYVCHLKNVHSAGGAVDVSINSSNGNNPFVVALVVQQTNIDNPN